MNSLQLVRANSRRSGVPRRRGLIGGALALASAPVLVSAALVAGSAAVGNAAVGHHLEIVSGGPTGSYVVPAGDHKIKHVIVIMQENRSFDSYFGTFPGADGIPMKNGKPTVCVPDPKTGTASSPTSTTPT